MNLELDEKALQVLRNVFEWTDSDGDGVISREDLRISGGLQSEKEVNEVFLALKKSCGNTCQTSNITYSEFCKGIMDFPFLLEHFKNEFVTSPLTIDISQINEEDESIPTNERERDSDMHFIIQGLQDAVQLYSKLLKKELPLAESNNQEDLLESLRIALEKIKNLFRHEGDSYACLINGSIELYLLVRDLARFNEEVISDYKTEIQEKDTTIYVLSEKCEYLSDENDRISNQLYLIENKAMKTKDAHSEILEEKKNLEKKLEKAEDSERRFQETLKNIESIIFSKEKAISTLEKELRQLNSFKTIQEMSGTYGRTTQDMKNRRNQGISHRKSVPISQLSPKRSVLQSPRNEFKVQMYSNQLKFKNEKVKEAEHELAKAEILIGKYEIETKKLKEENRMLLEKLQFLKINKMKSEEVESERNSMIPSLFEEFMLIKDGSTVGRVSGKVVVAEIGIDKEVQVEISVIGINAAVNVGEKIKVIEANTIENKDQSVQASVVFSDNFTQANILKVNPDSSRSCFSCF